MGSSSCTERPSWRRFKLHTELHNYGVQQLLLSATSDLCLCELCQHIYTRVHRAKDCTGQSAASNTNHSQLQWFQFKVCQRLWGCFHSGLSLRFQNSDTFLKLGEHHGHVTSDVASLSYPDQRLLWKMEAGRLCAVHIRVQHKQGIMGNTGMKISEETTHIVGRLIGMSKQSTRVINWGCRAWNKI